MHFLVIPKVKSGLSRLSKATEENAPTLGHLLYVAQKVAKQGLHPPHFQPCAEASVGEILFFVWPIDTLSPLPELSLTC